MSNIALYNALIKAGVSEAQAEKAADNTVSIQDVATKTDIIRLETKVSETQASVAELKVTASKTQESISTLQKSIGKTNTSVAKIKSEILRWVVIIGGIITTAIIGSAGWVISLLIQLVQRG